jgi:hypothetical protein
MREEIGRGLTEVLSDPTCVCRVPMFDEAVVVCVRG